MKKLFLMTFVACFAMMFASCNKELELNGTTWKASQTFSESYTEDGITGSITMEMDCTMNFADATKGTLAMTMSGSLAIGGISVLPLEPDTQVADFTYTFDGTNGTLTSVDKETGENATIPFTYNKKDKTILISINEKEEDLGVDIKFDLVFTQE